MAVIGMDLFSARFAAYRESFVVIGGAACDLWFASRNLRFRTTNDLDLVLVLDHLSAECAVKQSEARK